MKMKFLLLLSFLFLIAPLDSIKANLEYSSSLLVEKSPPIKKKKYKKKRRTKKQRKVQNRKGELLLFIAGISLFIIGTIIFIIGAISLTSFIWIGGLIGVFVSFVLFFLFSFFYLINSKYSYVILVLSLFAIIMGVILLVMGLISQTMILWIAGLLYLSPIVFILLLVMMIIIGVK